MTEGAHGPTRVVIIGASMAGLCAAAACAGQGRRVVVLERDRLPRQAVARPGVPQGEQPHVVLRRGMLALQDLLPGVEADLKEAGGITIDTGDLAWLAESGWAPFGMPAFTILSVSRPLLEHVVRRRVQALSGVAIRDGERVASLSPGDVKGTWMVTLAEGGVLEADLVVDASGRSSRMPVWLRDAGLGSVRVSEVDARVGYATRAYLVPPGAVVPGGIVLQVTPDTMTGATALPVEGDRWLITPVGVGPRRPPRDVAGFEEFMAALADPAVAEVAAAGRPVGDVHLYRQTANRRHHYERLRGWPQGLLVLGDALCAFDPVYGQGITVAAWQALALRAALRSGAPARMGRLQRRFARLASLPWNIATGQDRRLTSSVARPSVPSALFGAWAGEVGRLAAHGDTRAARAMARVYHLMASPIVLAHPGLLIASVRTRARGVGPSNPRPPILRTAGSGPMG